MGTHELHVEESDEDKCTGCNGKGWKFSEMFTCTKCWGSGKT